MATAARTAPPTSSTVVLHWSAIIAGAIAASALAFVLHSFAGAIGLSISSTAPTWRDASSALILLAGLYLILVALMSYGFGAYIAARVMSATVVGTEEREFSDGLNGLIVWALATLLTGLITLATIQVLPRLAIPSNTSSSASTSVAGENLLAYDLDRLFRSERRPQGLADMGYIRGEAARILLTVSSHRGMDSEDRSYLARLVTATTGLAPPEAERRVDAVIARASDNIARARHSAVILGFMVGAAALMGSIAAWFAACAGGRYRDGREELHPLWEWGRSFPRR